VLEAFSPKEERATLVVLEQALRRFHGTCKSAVADMPPQTLQTFKANTSFVAAEAYAR
jgi:hypothetical protein